MLYLVTLVVTHLVELKSDVQILYKPILSHNNCFKFALICVCIILQPSKPFSYLMIQPNDENNFKRGRDGPVERNP